MPTRVHPVNEGVPVPCTAIMSPFCIAPELDASTATTVKPSLFASKRIVSIPLADTLSTDKMCVVAPNPFTFSSISHTLVNN